MKLILSLSVLILSFNSFAEDKITMFVSLTPAGSFQAVSKKPKGNLIKENGAFSADKISVSIESFKTGIELRDEHLWKHMQSSKFPKATLSELKASGGKGTANLEVNGIKKAVTISFQEKGQEVEAKLKVKASDFKLPKAEYLGVGVDDVVSIEVTLAYKAR
jgi:polyisoprenoid-binding protein YceI